MNGILQTSTRREVETNAARQRVARAFARGAPTYDRHAELQRHVADRLLRQMPTINDDATVVDLGCGTGYCTQLIRQRTSMATVIGLDLAVPMLQLTRQRCGERLPLLCADAQSLPLRDASSDLIVSSLTVQWCNDVRKLFAELQRVLRPGGCVLLSTLGPETLQELRAAWAQVDASRAGNEFVSHAVLLAAAHAAGLYANITTELRVRHYQSLNALVRELKALGANAATSANPIVAAPAAFKAASAAFANKREPSGIPVSWEIFYLRLQKPVA